MGDQKQEASSETKVRRNEQGDKDAWKYDNMGNKINRLGQFQLPSQRAGHKGPHNMYTMLQDLAETEIRALKKTYPDEDYYDSEGRSLWHQRESKEFKNVRTRYRNYNAEIERNKDALSSVILKDEDYTALLNRGTGMGNRMKYNEQGELEEQDIDFLLKRALGSIKQKPRTVEDEVIDTMKSKEY